jgi:hypothetical protein
VSAQFFQVIQALGPSIFDRVWKFLFPPPPTVDEILQRMTDADYADLIHYHVSNGGQRGGPIPDEIILSWHEHEQRCLSQAWWCLTADSPVRPDLIDHLKREYRSAGASLTGRDLGTLLRTAAGRSRRSLATIKARSHIRPVMKNTGVDGSAGASKTFSLTPSMTIPT